MIVHEFILIVHLLLRHVIVHIAIDIAVATAMVIVCAFVPFIVIGVVTAVFHFC